MKNKTLLISTISVIGIGLIQVIPAIAGESPVNREIPESAYNDLRGERNSYQYDERSESLAKQYGVALSGISTEGKTLEELEVEFKNEEGDYQISEEKSEELNVEKYRLELGNRHNTLIKRAKELGIETKNKEIELIQQEILNQLLIDKAQELGISVENVDFDTLKSKLKEANDSQK